MKMRFKGTGIEGESPATVAAKKSRVSAVLFLRPLALPDFRTGERLERLAGGIQQKTLAVPGCTDEDARARPIPGQRVARQVVDAINLLAGAVKLHDRPGVHR